MRKVLMLLIALILIVSIADGRSIYYVKNSGNDSNSGNSTANAFATPSHAVALLAPGDIVYLDGTWCNERLVLNASGVPGGRAIEIKALPGKSPVLYSDVGHSAWGSQEFGYFGIDIRNQSNIKISGITMAGYRTDVYVADASNIQVSGMTHHPVNGYDSCNAILMYFNVTNSSYNNNTCDQLYHDTVMVWGIRNPSTGADRYTRNIVVNGNRVTNSTTHALIDLNDDVNGIMISNNYLEDNDSDGVWMHTYDDDYSNVTITGNTFNNCLLPIRAINTTNFVCTYNVCTGTGSSAMSMYGPYGSQPSCNNTNVYVAHNQFDKQMGVLNVIGGLFEYNTLPSDKKCTFVNSTGVTVHNSYVTDFPVQVNAPSQVTIVNDN